MELNCKPWRGRPQLGIVKLTTPYEIAAGPGIADKIGRRLVRIAATRRYDHDGSIRGLWDASLKLRRSFNCEAVPIVAKACGAGHRQLSVTVKRGTRSLLPVTLTDTVTKAFTIGGAGTVPAVGVQNGASGGTAICLNGRDANHPGYPHVHSQSNRLTTIGIAAADPTTVKFVKRRCSERRHPQWPRPSPSNAYGSEH